MALPPTADGGARGDLDALVGHLDALRETSLTRLQQARLDLALGAAEALAERLGIGPAPEPTSAPAAPAARTLRALVVDDNSINRHIAVRMLQVLGIHAAEADSGAEALAAIAEMPYHLILLDVMLPGMDGFEIAREIRSLYGARVVVVGVTAMSDADLKGRAAGMDAVYVKPLRVEDLKEAIGLCVRI